MKISVPALECIQNGKHFYLFMLNKDVLDETTFVSRREKDPKDGFQRNLNEARAKDIAKYFDEKEGVIPSPLILSAQNNANFKFSKGIVSFDVNKMAFMVLDGQHRLYGLLKTKKEYVMPVAVFKGLSLKEEINLFIDINTNQKGVPTTLLIDIKNLTGSETSIEAKQRYLFNELNKKSIMSGMFSPSSSKVGKITRVAFNKATKDIVDNSLISRMDEDKILHILKNYLMASDIIFQRSKSQKAKLNNSIFFRSLLAVSADVIERSLDKHKNVKVDSLVDIMEPLSKINYDSYIGTSEATYSKVVSDMKAEIKKDRIILLSDSIF